MTILLDHIPTSNNASARPLIISSHQRQEASKRPCHPSTPCGSPPRFRNRNPVSPSPESRPNKAPRSISPGGTPSSSPCLRRRVSASPPRSARKVRWAYTLVSMVTTRPKTCREDIPSLFYSREDEKRFRREAEFDPVPPESEEPSSPTPSLPNSWSCSKKDYAISKAVVVFGETTKTFESGIWSFPTNNAGGCAIQASSEKTDSFSFDDPAFWNGILTWS